ncbi:MAG: hypothetical protein HUK22_03760, partial [Thermoguttaceae bacterium]|nr:hypothetical protein [Thermoguttaceae bacterium]
MFFLVGAVLSLAVAESGAFAQGFGDYAGPGSTVPAASAALQQTTPQSAAQPSRAAAQSVAAPQNRRDLVAQNPAQTQAAPVAAQATQSAARQAAPATAQAVQSQRIAQPAGQTAVQTQVSAQAQGKRPPATTAQRGGVLSDEPVESAFVSPPAKYKATESDVAKLNEFLAQWEDFGKGIKRVSCDVHVKEFDLGLLSGNAEAPLSHTWGEFRFVAPNKLLYHIKGQFAYEPGAEPVWQSGKNEWEVVLDGKYLSQYDFENKKIISYPLPEDEQNIDLSMDNGQFPLFFVAKADVLRNRFYMQIVTPKKK